MTKYLKVTVVPDDLKPLPEESGFYLSRSCKTMFHIESGQIKHIMQADFNDFLIDEPKEPTKLSPEEEIYKELKKQYFLKEIEKLRNEGCNCTNDPTSDYKKDYFQPYIEKGRTIGATKEPKCQNPILEKLNEKFPSLDAVSENKGKITISNIELTIPPHTEQLRLNLNLKDLFKP